MTTICFDFGNTLKKIAVFKDGLIITSETIGDLTEEKLLALINKYKPQKSILSSVINHEEFIELILSQNTNFKKLTSKTSLPFTTPVSKPETIGADRLALCAAAIRIFPESNNLIISLGSCITYNFINKYHQFLGGSISPGMEMRLKSLNVFTAKLPLVAADWNFPLLGYDTRTNILSGVLLGMTKEIDGIIDEYAMKYSNFNVLLTGGDVTNFARHLKNKIFADPQLIFKGLYAISEYDDTKT